MQLGIVQCDGRCHHSARWRGPRAYPATPATSGIDFKRVPVIGASSNSDLKCHKCHGAGFVISPLSTSPTTYIRLALEPLRLRPSHHRIHLVLSTYFLESITITRLPFTRPSEHPSVVTHPSREVQVSLRNTRPRVLETAIS